jgi:hypothetical protein
MSICIDECPSTVARIGQSLQENGISMGCFDPHGVITAADALKKDHSLRVRTVAGIDWLFSSHEDATVDTILSQAGRIMRSRGVATVSDLLAEVGEHQSQSVDEAMLRQSLESAPGMMWVDPAQNWFLLPTRRNVLATFLKKILSVAPKIHISELRTGLTRHYRLAIAPPRDVLLRVCSALGCRVNGEYVEAQEPMPPNEILSPTEQTFYDVLTKEGPLLPRRRLEEICMQLGMNRHTFWVYLSYSPILERFAPGVYGLRGAEFASGAAEALMDKRRSGGRVLRDFGWRKGGIAWFAYKVSEGMIQSGVCSMPAGMRDALGDGEWPLSSSDGIRMGTLVCRDTSMWGLGPLFRRRGVEVGDTLIVEINRGGNKATVHLGSDEILETLASSAQRE